MIKFRATNNDGSPVIGIGLEAENIQRLQDGKPIVFNLIDVGLPSCDVMVFAGDDQADLIAKLKDAGFELPDTPPTVNESARIITN